MIVQRRPRGEEARRAVGAACLAGARAASCNGPMLARRDRKPLANQWLARGLVLCAREELNLHALNGHWHLKPARLPFRHSRNAAMRQPEQHSTASPVPGKPVLLEGRPWAVTGRAGAGCADERHVLPRG